MSDHNEPLDEELPPEEKLGKLRGVDTDPLVALQPEMELMNQDWYDRFDEAYVQTKTDSEEYRDQYLLAFREWREHMTQFDRHETLPSVTQVELFIKKSLKTQSPGVVKTKIRYIREVYKWMQEENGFPHPTSWDPFLKALKRNKLALTSSDADDFPVLDLEDVQRKVHEITNIAERAVIVFQLKTGVRSSELCNIRFSEIKIANHEVMNHYEPLGIGSDPILDDKQNVVYIPRDEVREKNKRKCPTVIPLDDETRATLIDYLLIRPDNGDEHVFLTKKGKPLDKGSLQVFWNNNWRPEYEYDEDDEFRSIAPHFARHWMSTWFRSRKSWNEPWVQYLRGDKMGPDIGTKRSAMHRYVHAYFGDIEERYGEDIFKLGIL
jgi:integrase/recombinase XerD